MKITYLILLGTLLVGACSNQPNEAKANVSTETTEVTTEAATEQQTPVIAHVNAKTFKAEMEKAPGVLLDVRTPGEFKKGYIKGARLLDIFSDNFDSELKKLDKNATYYVYCASGGRSEECAEKMKSLGFKKVFNLERGIREWLSSGYEVVTP